MHESERGHASYTTEGETGGMPPGGEMDFIEGEEPLRIRWKRISDGDFAGLHIKDPDGVNVQISSQK